MSTSLDEQHRETRTIEEVLRNRVKIVGDGEWTLLGTPNDVIKELEALQRQETLEARIAELGEVFDTYLWEDGMKIYLIERKKELEAELHTMKGDK